MIVTYKIEPQDIKSIKDAALGWYGLKISNKDAREVFKDQKFCQNYSYWGMDTSTRELLSERLITMLGVEGSWPINGSTDVETLTFYDAFCPAALNRSWITIQDHTTIIEGLRKERGYGSLKEMIENLQKINNR